MKNKIDKFQQKLVDFWQGLEDLNPRHSVLETDVLPTELNPYVLNYYTRINPTCQVIFTKKYEKNIKTKKCS